MQQVCIFGYKKWRNFKITLCFSINHKIMMHSLTEQRNFIIVIQTSLLMNKFGNNIVSMDDTHGTNSYDFSLITVLVIDEFCEGCPGAWCLCNRTDKYILIDFLIAVKNTVGCIKPHWVMSDDAEQYYNAWVAVFGMGPHKLLCIWHVDNA